MCLILSVSIAICAVVEPVLVSLPPKVANISFLRSVVNTDIFKVLGFIF